MTNLSHEITNYNGQDMAIKDIPDPFVRQMLGYGHVMVRERSVIIVEGRTWETTPDVCTYSDMPWEWVWVGPTQYLVCPKCGLDGT